MSNYSEIFYAEFIEQPPADMPFTPAQYRISFRLNGYTGSASELLVYKDTPVKISKADSSSVTAAIVALKAEIKLRFQSVADAEQFYVTDDRTMQVVLQRDPTGGSSYTQDIFKGWVLPTDLSLDYKKPPFALNVIAVCGLSTLKERPFLAPDGKRLKGKVSITQVLRTALYYTDISQSLITGYNLYEQSDLTSGLLVSGLANPATDPLYRELIDADLFIADSGEVKNCYDVLTEQLTAKVMGVGQVDGFWMAIRYPEAAGNYDPWNTNSTHTIHTRGHYSAYLDDAPVDGLDKSIDLTVLTSLTGAHRVKNRSPKMGKLSVKNGVRVEQRFGRYRSKLPDFSDVDSTGLPTGFTTNNLQTQNRFVTGDGTEDNPLRLVIMDAGDEKFNKDTPLVRVKIVYGTNSPEYKYSYKRTYKGRARLTNAAAVKMGFMVYRDDGYYYLSTDGWMRFAGPSIDVQKPAQLVYNTYVDPTTGHAKTNPVYFDFSIDLGQLDRVEELYVYYCMPEALTHYNSNGSTEPANEQNSGVRPKVEFLPGSIELEQATLRLDGYQQTIVKTGKKVKDTSLTILVGDVAEAAAAYDRAGTTYKRASLAVSVLHYKPNADILAANPTGKDVGKSSLSWVTEFTARQAMYSGSSFEADIWGRWPYGPFTVLRIGDVVSSTNDPLNHLLPRWEWDVLKALHTVTAYEIIPESKTLPISIREWQTPNGTIPIDTDDSGNPIEPPVPSRYDDLLNLQGKLAGIGIFPPVSPLPTVNGAAPTLPTELQIRIGTYKGGQSTGLIEAVYKKLPFLKLIGH